MKKISLILLIAILISGCSNTMPDEQNNSKETITETPIKDTPEVDKEVTEMPTTQDTSELNGDSSQATTETPTTQNTPEVDENGSVKFQEGGISINFNLNDEQIIPSFDLLIGKVSNMKLSPNKMFLYIVTAQGGGSASFIYNIEKDEVYFLGNEIKGIGEWQEDGKLKVENKQEFGESIGEVSSVYESDNADEPWKLSKK